MDGTAGCRQTLWEICTGLWSRPVCPPRLTTDQPVAWSTSAHLSAEWMTPCSTTSFIACGSSIAHLRYSNMLCLSISVWFIGWLLTDIFTSLQNVPLQDTNRSLGFLGWGSACWLNLKCIASACASHSRHPSAGDKKAPKTFFYLLASTSPFLLLLLQPRSPCRSTKTQCPPPPRSLSFKDEGCHKRQKKMSGWMK